MSLPQLRYNMILYSEKITLHPLVHAAAAAAAKLHQSCPTLCDPIEGSPPGSPVPGILQARTLAAAAAKSLQSCPTLCNPIDVCQPTRFPHPWDSPGKNTGVVAISFSSAWKWKVKVKSFSHVRLSATPWTEAYQAPPSLGFSRQEYWSGVPLPSPKNTGVGCNFLLQCIKVKVKSLSHVRLLVTPWTTAHQAPPSMGFSRQEFWSGMPLPFPPLVHTLFQNNIKELILS